MRPGVGLGLCHWQEDLITESFDELLDEDLKTADLVLWVGISFLQSASVEHFRRVRRAMGSVDRLGARRRLLRFLRPLLVPPCTHARRPLNGVAQSAR